MSGAALDPPSRTAALAALAHVPSAEWTDEQLVDACLGGNQRAWDLLIARYKSLIFSFPRKYGAPSHEAADVFQLVCVELFVALPRLRNRESVRAWISTVASHEAYRWKRRHVVRIRREDDATDVEAPHAATPSKQFLQAEQEQLVREAVSQLPNRYRAVIELLFFEEPPLPYQIVAERLGVAPGSVSFLRARGLRKLERILEQVEPRTA